MAAWSFTLKFFDLSDGIRLRALLQVLLQAFDLGDGLL